MGGLTLEKLAIVLVIALIVLGPERLPTYAQKLGEFVRNLKRMTESAKDRVKDEMGEEYDEVDWKQLDPRQYDPRKIIREALVEEERSPEARRARAIAAARRRRQERMLDESADSGETEHITTTEASTAAPGQISEEFYFDDEAT